MRLTREEAIAALMELGFWEVSVEKILTALDRSLVFEPEPAMFSGEAHGVGSLAAE